MKNQSETKKQSGQPTYGDKPWQSPQYGEKNQKKNAQQKDPQEGSCGCGSDSEKGNKK